ncbi:MAG TPA: hypothetical protein VJ691_08685 [Vicinamibacterales bacterium]|nr:hypothetical protein [Vicinamibacterales bacterium]
MLALVAACLIISVEAFAQSPPHDQRARVTLSLDPDLSIDTGADLTFSLMVGISDLEELAFSRLERGARRNIPFGIAKAVLLDHPLAVFMLVFQHEAFGHGGRAREFGADATFRMGSPWTRDMLFNGGTRFGGGASWGGREVTPAERGRIYAAGTEANTRSATLIERELVAGTRLRTGELLYYLRSRWYPSQYVLRTPNPATDPAGFFAESSGGDVPNYLAELNRKYYGESGITPAGVSPTLLNEYRRLRRHAFVNLMTPGAWLALWSAGRDVGIGSDAKPMPALRLGDRRFLPLVNADWMVDGGAISIEAIFSGRVNANGSRWFSLLTRQGNGPGGRFWNAGAATDQIARWRSLALGGEIELWRQPSFGTGAGVNAHLRVHGGWMNGLQIHGGVKSDGDWPGRPANGGGFLRIGYSYMPRR